MKVFVYIFLLCIVFTLNSQTTSTVSGGIRTAHSNENFFFKTPTAPFFTESIYNNPLWLEGIHSQITGEFMEISAMGEASLTNSVALHYRFRHFFNSGSGLFSGIGYLSAAHKQNFEVLYFNFQTENLRQITGTFESNRNSIDFHLGYSLRPFQKTDLIIDAGPMLQWVKYKPVEAQVGSYRFEWEGQTEYWLPGAALQVSYDFIPESNFTVGLSGEVRGVIIDKNITPFAGISLQLSYYHSRPHPTFDEPLSLVSQTPLPGGVQRTLPFYLTRYQVLLDSAVISQNTLSVSYTSAFMDEHTVQSTEPFDGIVFLDAEEVFINNTQNETYELSHQIPGTAPVAFQTQDYNVYPQFIVINNLSETESSFLIHLQSETSARTVIVYNNSTQEALSSYPDLDRKIKDGKSKVSSGRERKERLRVKRDSILAHYDSLEQKYRQLAYIDKILERYPPVFKERVQGILDSLEKYGERRETAVDKINQIKAEKEDCENRKDEISGLLADQENECKKLREEVEAAIRKLESAYLMKMGITATITLDGVGGYSVTFNDVMLNEYDKTTRRTRDEIRKMRRELKVLTQKLKECEDQQAHLLEQLDALADLCETLKEKEETAKEEQGDASSTYNAYEQELKDLCDSIKKAVTAMLQKWCDENPSICDFNEELEDVLNNDCPKTKEEWEAFWDKFNDLLGKKIDLEQAIQNEMEQTEEDYGNNVAESDKADDEIGDGLKEIFDAENEAVARRKDEARASKTAADDKRKRDEERRKRKEKEQKIKDLIKRIKDGEDVGDDALKDLLIMTGLALLDEATGDLKIGTIIGGLLVVKDQPDCVCPMLIALKNAIAAANRGDRLEAGIFANEFIRLWKDCGNLPHISSIMEGSNFLTDAIMDMTKEQKQQALEALQSAINVNCK